MAQPRAATCWGSGSPLRGLLLAAALLAAGPAIGAPPVPPPTADPALVEQGRRMYVDGVRPDGRALQAERLDAGLLAGKAAACIACHRRSGLGGMEGDFIVPPVSGPALYAGPLLRERVIISMDPRRGRFLNPSHPAYDQHSLLAAIRDGVHVTGRPMIALMPRYRIDEREFAALKAYLDQLSAQWPPGVTEKSVRFATVITPEVDPVSKDAFLRSLHALFDQKYSNTLPGHRHMINAAEGMLNLERYWDLDVWELQGPSSTWAQQLQARYREAPVFALVSGLGGAEWGPVQDFCERERMPCWFPSVVSPPAGAAEQTYSLYFSNGVGLEAQVLAAHLGAAEPARRPARVVQVLRDEPAGRSAAEAFARASRGAGWTIEQRVLGSAAWPGLAEALRGIGPGDAVALWLRPADLRALEDVAPPPALAYASTYLGGGERAPVPAAWRRALRLIYPYELPERRVTNLATFHSWLDLRKLPLVDEGMQSEVFFAIGYLNFTLSDLLDNLYRDAVIDRGETMVRRRELARAEEEVMIRQGGHPPARQVGESSRLAPGPIFGTDAQGPLAQKNTQKLGERQGTTIYPHLELATGQRFASKGAYIVRFAAPEGEALVAESDWIVP